MQKKYAENHGQDVIAFLLGTPNLKIDPDTLYSLDYLSQTLGVSKDCLQRRFRLSVAVGGRVWGSDILAARAATVQEFEAPSVSAASIETVARRGPGRPRKKNRLTMKDLY